MKTLRRLWLQLAGLFSSSRRDRASQEFEEEMESHLAMHVEDNMRAGMTAAQARREALMKLGGERTRQARREGGTVVLLENLLQDLRFAARQLRKNKGFAFTAILILSLGICANVAIFSFVDAVLIKPLPYQRPAQLISLYESTPLGPRFHLSYLDYLDWKKMNKVFSSVEAYDNNAMLMPVDTGVQPVDAVIVSDGFFRALGVRPVLGRDFHSGEDLESAPRTVVLSYAAWQNRFGGRVDALGKAVTLDGVPYAIVGVLPKEFYFAPVGSAEFWRTLHMSSSSDRGEHGLLAVGRLKDGVSLATASVEMNSIAQQLAKQYPDADEGRGASLVGLTESITGNLRPILLLLLCGAGLLLLIACVNVASLLLVRTESRRREIAVRGALGASRARLMRQFVTEGVLLVASGAAIGVVGAYWMMQALARLIPQNMLANMPYLNGLRLNAHVMMFAGCVALLCGVLFSLTPMIRLPLSDMQAGLAEGGRGGGGTVWRRMGANLVVLELCTAMVLLVGAGLLAKSFYLLMHADLGLQPERLATLRVRAMGAGYAKDAQVAALGRRLVSEVERLPGVQSAAVAQILPVGNGGGNTTFEVVGRPGSQEGNESTTREVSAGYFGTVQARLLRGRYFGEDEDAAKPPVMIVNEAFARTYFAGEDPINRQIRYDSSTPAVTIVGVVGDIKEGAIDSAVQPVLYTPFDQGPSRGFYVVARTAQSPLGMPETMAATVHGIDAMLLTSDGETMTNRIAQSQSAYLHRSSAWLVGGFALLALVLGMVGLYGVVAYSVSRRTREIGVRMALGAQRGSVSRMILREAGWLVAAGVMLGAVCSIGAARLMGTLLFGVSAWDVPTLIAVAVVLSGSAMLASFLPAARAAKVDPVVALRAE